MARWVGVAPTNKSTQGSLRIPGGSGEGNMDNGEVGLRRGGMETSEAMQQSASPPQADPDVGHLLSMLAASLRMGTPRINTFSGDAIPGKTEVSFEQWYHKVQCIEDHYLEAVVWESIIRSLKGAVADMARYMGPTMSVDHIMPKLSVIFGTVASFDIFMQNFYKETQGNNEKVPSFARRLEGTLSQIQVQCLRKMMDLETQQHLRDCLFHGVCKLIHDSVWYLYSAPDSSSQLMVAPRRSTMKVRRPGKSEG